MRIRAFDCFRIIVMCSFFFIIPELPGFQGLIHNFSNFNYGDILSMIFFPPNKIYLYFTRDLS